MSAHCKSDSGFLAWHELIEPRRLKTTPEAAFRVECQKTRQGLIDLSEEVVAPAAELDLSLSTQMIEPSGDEVGGFLWQM